MIPCRLNGEDSKLFLPIINRRRQLLHFNVYGEEGQPGRSLESSGWWDFLPYTTIGCSSPPILNIKISYKTIFYRGKYICKFKKTLNLMQAARETGALKEAKDKLEKRVEELTWRLEFEKHLRVYSLSTNSNKLIA